MSKIEILSSGNEIGLKCVRCGSVEKITLEDKRAPLNEREFNEELKKVIPARPLTKQKIVN
jgi:hypothetical protein